MSTKFFKKFISLLLILVILVSTNVFANSVVIANSPNGGGNNYSGKMSPKIFTTTVDNENTNVGPGAGLGDNSFSISNGPQDLLNSSQNNFKTSQSTNNTASISNTRIITSNTTTSDSETTLVKFSEYNTNVEGKPSITSESAILVNFSTKQIYASKNLHSKLPPASLANLVTSYLLVTNSKLDDAVTVSKTAISNMEKGANNIGLVEGDQITVNDLLHSMLMKSACDSANVSAEKVSKNINDFVKLMNETVKSWGCTDTNFTNPSGLNNEKQITSAYDMAIILYKVSKNPTLCEILKKVSYTLPKTNHRKELPIESSFKIINPSSSYYNKDCLFGKQGYTSKALYTLACNYKYNDQEIATIILKSSGTHYQLSKDLFNFAKKVIDSDLKSQKAGNWKQDSKGWYYIKNDGTKAVSEWITVNNVKYCVDSDGYMITGWKEFTNGNLYYFDQSTGALKINTWVNTPSGAYYLQSDGSLARAEKGKTKTIETSAGKYVIDENGKAISKAS